MALASEFLPFGPWTPDLGRINNPGLTLATNVIPTATGYLPVKGPEYSGAALDRRVIASHALRHGGAHVLVGTNDALYQQEANLTWTNVSKTNASNEQVYAPMVDRWEMESFGPHVVAVSHLIPPQVLNVTDVNPAFVDLPNAPLWATCVGTVRDFMVMGNIGGLGDNYIQWSGFNNIELWTPSIATQSDTQPLSGMGGAVQQIVSGDVGYIFMENSIYSMTYVGPPTIFKLDEFATGRGTTAPQSVVKLDNTIYYYDNAGFYKLDIRNNQFTPIGYNRVDRHVANLGDAECRARLQGTVDPVNKIVMWAMCTDAASVDLLNTIILMYHYELDRWTTVEVDSDHLSVLPTPAASLDDLSMLLGRFGDADGDPNTPDTLILANIDDDSIQVESDLYTGGSFIPIIFGTNHRLGSLTDGNLPATLATGEIGTLNGNFQHTTQQRPYVDYAAATSVSCQIEYRDDLNVVAQETLPSVQEGTGGTIARAKARYLRYIVRITGGFNHATGLEIYKRTTG